jgi:L-rhamnose mutarotase
MQRFCLTLAMYPDAALIEEYKERHRHVWPEVLQSLRDAGVLDMQIYLHENRLYMVLETSDDFSFERKSEMDRANPTVMQWEREMARYQAADPATDASARWQRLECVFALPKSEAQ